MLLDTTTATRDHFKLKMFITSDHGKWHRGETRIKLPQGQGLFFSKMEKDLEKTIDHEGNHVEYDD